MNNRLRENLLRAATAVAVVSATAIVLLPASGMAATLAPLQDILQSIRLG